MATYIKGEKNFYPDIKPFTPDYKFLSATLDARQAKYNAGWKAQNDLYNKVVYSPLTNPNSLEYQRQYAEKLGPSLEKISGMDLSLEQNVQTAKSAFAPFFEDDEVVYDMVWTGAYNDAIKKYQELASSNNQETRELANSEVSLRKLEIDRRKFMEAGRGELQSQPLPELILDADLVQNAQKYLSALDPGLTISMPIPNMKDTGKVDGKGNPILMEDKNFIITQKNGSLVEGPAYEQIMSALIDDPRVQKFYNAKSYVQAYDFAETMVGKGVFATEQEGLNAWASEQISRIENKNLEYQTKKEYELRKQNEVNVNWDNYASNHGVVSGSYDEKIMNQNISDAERMKIDLDRLFKINQFAASSDPDDEALFNKAMALLSNYNIDTDVRAAARQFSMREMEVTQEQNNFELENLKYKHDWNLQIKKFQLQELADFKKFERDKILKQIEGGGLDYAQMMKNSVSPVTGQGANFAVDKNNNFVGIDNPLQMDIVAMQERGNELLTDRLGMLEEMIANSGLYDVAGQPGMYNIPLVENPDPNEPKDYYQGNLQDVVKKISNRELDDDQLETDNYQYADGIESLFANLQQYYANSSEAHQLGIDTSPNSPFMSISNKLFNSGTSITTPGLATQIELYNTAVDLAMKDQYDKARLIETSLSNTNKKDLSNAEKNIHLLLENGYVFPIDNESKSIMTEEEFYKANMERINSGEIDINKTIEFFGLGNDADLTQFEINPVSLGNLGVTFVPSFGNFDEGQYKKNLGRIYKRFKTDINKLMSTTPSRTFVNNSAGLGAVPASNIRFNVANSTQLSLAPKAGTAQNKFLGDFYGQINANKAKGIGNYGFIGTTIKSEDNDDFVDILSADAIDVSTTKNKAAQYIYDRIANEQTLNADNLSLNLTFYDSYGPEIRNIETGELTNEPYAAYELNNFSDPLIKTLTDVENSLYPEGVDAKDIREVLTSGFTYIFPRSSTIAANPLGYAVTQSNTTLEKRIASTNNNILTIDPTAYAAPYFAGNAGHGSFSFQKVGNRINVNGYLNHYESDASKYPNGYRQEPVSTILGGEQENKIGYDEYYEFILGVLSQQKIKNDALYDAASKESKNN